MVTSDPVPGAGWLAVMTLYLLSFIGLTAWYGPTERTTPSMLAMFAAGGLSILLFGIRHLFPGPVEIAVVVALAAAWPVLIARVIRYPPGRTVDD